MMNANNVAFLNFDNPIKTGFISEKALSPASIELITQMQENKNAIEFTPEVEQRAGQLLTQTDYVYRFKGEFTGKDYLGLRPYNPINAKNQTMTDYD